MTLKILQKYANSWRLDHPDLKDVSETIFAKGVITAFYAGTDDGPIVAKDMCDLTVDGKEFTKVPIWYHPQKDWVENWKLNTDPSAHAWGILETDSAAWAEFWEHSGTLVDKDGGAVQSVPDKGLKFDNHAVARGGYAFSVDDEVVVMLQKDEAVAVLGFADGIPRRPYDYVQAEMPTQVMDTSDDPPNVGDPHTPYILQLSDLNRVVTPSGTGPGWLPPTGNRLGPDGFGLHLEKEAKIFPDKVAHPPPGDPIPFELNWNYQCFYGSEKVSRGNIELIGYYWTPNPDPQFGPFNGWMNYGLSVPFSPWADYLEAWKNTCDIVQTLDRSTMDPNSWVGAWPGGYGRPDNWKWLVDDPNAPDSQVTRSYVMRTYLIEAGPLLYLFRIFYQHMTPPAGGGKVWYWKNRIAWSSNSPPLSDWSGYSGVTSGWTPPMWSPDVCPNPYPTKIEDCYPPPDGYLPGNNNQETFYGDAPTWVYVAPSSKKILDSIESRVAASNAQVDVIAAMGAAVITAVPEGFSLYDVVGSHSIIPSVGNIRQLKFKYAKRIGT